MPIRLNSLNGSVTLDAVDGVGNVNIEFPRTALATETYVSTQLNNLVDSAPGALNTLNELAAALGDDASFSTTVTNSLATKLAINNNLSDLDNPATARSNLGVAIGSDVQAYDVDIVKTDIAQTFTTKQTFAGNASSAAIEFKNAVEDGTVSATAATGTINYDILSQSVLYYTSNATGNWTVNVRGDSNTTLSSLMDVGDSITLAFLVTQGGTAYYNNVFKVDGVTVTPKWSGGNAPDAGNASSLDAYTYSVIKTGSASFVVLASQTQFA